LEVGVHEIDVVLSSTEPWTWSVRSTIELKSKETRAADMFAPVANEAPMTPMSFIEEIFAPWMGLPRKSKDGMMVGEGRGPSKEPPCSMKCDPNTNSVFMPSMSTSSGKTGTPAPWLGPIVKSIVRLFDMAASTAAAVTVTKRSEPKATWVGSRTTCPP